MKQVFEMNGLVCIAASFLWVFFHPEGLGIIGELGVALVLFAVGLVLFRKAGPILEWLAPEESILADQIQWDRQTELTEFGEE